MVDVEINLDGHAGIVGITRSGKTYLAKHLYNEVGGLYIDIEDKGEINSDITLNKYAKPEYFDMVLRKHKRVRYVPDPKLEKARKEIAWICRRLLTLNESIYFWVDEIQNYGNARTNECDIIATRGLKHGVHLMWMTQRPAKVSKTIASQSYTIVFFDFSGFEKKSFKEYDLPYDEIKSKIDNQPKYYFVIFTKGVGVSEAYKI